MEAGLRLDHLDRILLGDGPALTAQLYRGIARLPDARSMTVLAPERVEAPVYDRPVRAALAR
jgi:hypothetical protein